NPFNEMARVTLDLSSSTRMNIQVFDLLGRSVLRLYNGEMIAGRHDLQIDASSLPSGVYFLHVNTDSVQLTRKFAVVK
ncbi:MAG: T9SS type A sorting domain-containing protein, partial [Desulfofustis sp.]